jgi:hypothetical protein
VLFSEPGDSLVVQLPLSAHTTAMPGLYGSRVSRTTVRAADGSVIALISASSDAVVSMLSPDGRLLRRLLIREQPSVVLEGVSAGTVIMCIADGKRAPTVLRRVVR